MTALHVAGTALILHIHVVVGPSLQTGGAVDSAGDAGCLSDPSLTLSFKGLLGCVGVGVRILSRDD